MLLFAICFERGEGMSISFANRLVCGVALLGVYVGCAGAQSMTTQEFMVRIQSEMLKPALDYCMEKVPADSERLRLAYESFKTKALAASNGVFVDLDDVASRPVPEDQWALPQELGHQVLEGIRQREPGEACRSFLGTMEGTTVQDLQGRINTAFEEYKSSNDGRR